MSEETDKKPNFDPIALERVDVNKDYPMEPDEFEVLYKHNCYCHMAHISQYGYPIVTPMFYVVLEDGHLYISSVQKYRKKIDQLIANPKVSVSISNDGSNASRQKSIQIIGKAEVSFDQELMKARCGRFLDIHHDIVRRVIGRPEPVSRPPIALAQRGPPRR